MVAHGGETHLNAARRLQPYCSIVVCAHIYEEAEVSDEGMTALTCPRSKGLLLRPRWDRRYSRMYTRPTARPAPPKRPTMPCLIPVLMTRVVGGSRSSLAREIAGLIRNSSSDLS